MKIALCILQLILCVIGVVIYIDLSRYCKKHAEEELEIHRKYIYSRAVAICVLVVIATILGIVSVFV